MTLVTRPGPAIRSPKNQSQTHEMVNEANQTARAEPGIGAEEDQGARRIAEVTGRPVYVFPKIWQLEELERRNSDFFPIEVR